LDFKYDEERIAYHSSASNWQRDFGYNDLYDKIFEYGSEMNRYKINFEYEGTEHILWSWKGDYWNLQSGAEMGLYVYNREVNNERHYDVVDFELPMTLSLYNCSGGNVENVFSWVPDENQWWITGFNPEFTEPDPNVMVTIGSVDFTGYQDMYNSLKLTAIDEDYNNLIFDDQYHTVWILWDKES
jgi:hypothetical protein